MEAKVMTYLNNPNVIKMYEVIENPVNVNSLIFFFEF